MAVGVGVGQNDHILEDERRGSWVFLWGCWGVEFVDKTMSELLPGKFIKLLFFLFRSPYDGVSNQLSVKVIQT